MGENKEFTISIRLNADTMNDINALADASDLNKSDTIRRLITESLERKKASGCYALYPKNTHMMKNGRPYTSYTDRDGVKYIDDALITDLLNDAKGQIDLLEISDWIQKELRHDPNIYPSSSYNLKHILQSEKGIYLTNNQFKDALFLAGYYPVRYDEVNWHYQLSLTRHDANITNPFYLWLKEHYNDVDCPEHDLLLDIKGDKKFPILADKQIILDHMISMCAKRGGRLDDNIKDMFEMLWNEYEDYRNSYYE